MRNEALYSVVAQVVPALLIALAVQFVGIRQAGHRAGYLLDEEEVQRRIASGEDLPNDPLVIMTALFGVLAVLAEGCAILVLLIGTGTWFSYVAGPFCTLAVLVLTLFIAWSYWAHLVQLSFGKKL
jgi:uncharacterized membrane protein YedE/YeeE